MTTNKDFQIENGVLQRYFGKADRVVIPDGVTRIGGTAFKGAQMKNMILPASLLSIGWNAFEDCRNLQSIVIPDSVTVMEERAFLSCKELKSVKLSAHITDIPSEAFANCENLSEITLPKGLLRIGAGAFSACAQLKEISFPETLTSIGNIAFNGCKNIKSVALPDALTHIGNYAFGECENLKSVIFGKQIASISTGAFFGCKNLQSLVLPKNIQKIASGAFPAEMKLKKCILFASSENAKQIDALLRAVSIHNLIYPFLTDNLETSEAIHKTLTAYVTNKKFRDEYIPRLIETEAAQALAKLLSLIKKMSVEEIDGYIEKSQNTAELCTLFLQYKKRLYPAEKLEKMEEMQMEKDFGLREKTLADYKKIFSIKKENDTYVIIGYKGAEAQVSVPARIRNIPVRIALKKADDLKEIVLEDGFVSIESRAFFGCGALQNIVIPASVTKIASDAFRFIHRLTVTSPQGSYAETYAKENGIQFEII